MERIALNQMIERAEQEISKDGQKQLAEDILRIIDELLDEEQERLDREINVHVVFSPSAAGTIKVALSNCDKRLESRVIHWDDFFSFGPINQIHQEDGRLNREQWMMERFNHEMFRRMMNHRLDNVMKELSNIPENRRIYLWCGENAHEQASLRLAMHALRGNTNKIHIMNATQLYKEIAYKYEPAFEPRFVGQFPLEALEEIISRFESAIPVDEHMKTELAADWKRLSETTETLRIWKNGEFVSLEEDAFDTEILNTIRELQQSGDIKIVQEGYVGAGCVVSDLIDRNIYDSVQYIEYRFWHLISCGQLKFKGIPYALYLYSVKIP
ncbi:DUF1835 domain-containing protein [Paenibacillus sp.]|uniref:DUF1835 domain-containing protein n=1 Tax=Paenibacillus sp. TaxID=58172 RepID=UPI00281999E5|nr:DUF1835 domain-containing protein [Paenibacillus sp.]MDR0267451.1 DUF1835 domain-containing protein [Paenibacillus sp.]